MDSIVVNGLADVCPGIGVEQRAEVSLLFSRISSEQVWKHKESQGRVGFLGEELEIVCRVRQTTPHSLGKKKSGDDCLISLYPSPCCRADV